MELTDDTEVMDSWPTWLAPIIGVSMYVAFRSTMALGANLQRFSMQREAAREFPRPRSQQPLLITGVVLFTVSGVLLSVPLIFAPQSLLSPCGVIIFIANAVFASCLNNERFEWRSDGMSLAGIAVGVVLCVIAAPKQTSSLTSSELIALCAQPLFISFMLLLIGVIISLFLVSRKLVNQLASPECYRSSSFSSPAIRSRTKSESSDSPPTLTTPPVHAAEPDPRAHTTFVLSLCMGGLAGCLGGLNITATKSILSLIVGTWQAEGFVAVLLSPAAWLIGFGLLFTYAAQIRRTTDGLEQCPAMIFVPVQTVTEENVAILGGLLYFQEYRQLSLSSAALFALGVVLAVGCVVRLTATRIRRSGGLEAAGESHQTPVKSGADPGEADGVDLL